MTTRAFGPRATRSCALRALGTACALLVVLLAPATARAYYEEAHLTGDDVRVKVDAAGLARIEHTLAWRVVAGTLRTLDLVGVESIAVPEVAATVTAEDGRVLPATLAMRDDHALRLTFDGKGLKRGRYRIMLAYQVDLVRTHELVKDGVMWRVVWSSPVPAEGFDAARVVFELPAAADEPRVVRSDLMGDGMIATLRREPDHDAMELVRPRVARGESVLWAVRVAPRAFSGVRDRELRPPPPPPPLPPNHFRLIAQLAALLALAFGYGAIAWRKTQSFEAACRPLGSCGRGVVAIPAWARVSLSGVAFAAGVGTQAAGAPTLGALVIALAMALAVIRAPLLWLPVRGPGRWLAMKPEEAFAVPRRSDAFDPSTLRGKVVLVLVALFTLALARLVQPLHPEAPYLVLLDALALVPFFATGVASQLPPDRARARASWMRRLFVRLTRNPQLRVAAWVRVPRGAAAIDELRLLARPRVAMPGLLGIEVGFAYWRAFTGFASSPEVLVRVNDASAASARMTTLARWLVPVPGRRPEERVYRFAPRFPTREGTVRLVSRLGLELVDRRLLSEPWELEERRVPPAWRDRGHGSAKAA